jgi:ferredoxin
MDEIVAAVLCFLAIQLVLVTLIVAAKRMLLPSGEITILVNEEKRWLSQPGGKLLTALAEQGIFLSSACGGGGSCGQCRCLVEEGGGAILPTELSSIKPAEARRGMRLSCQVPVKRMISKFASLRKCWKPASGSAGFAPTVMSLPLSRNWSLNCPPARRSTSNPAVSFRSKCRPTL